MWVFMAYQRCVRVYAEWDLYAFIKYVKVVDGMEERALVACRGRIRLDFDRMAWVVSMTAATCLRISHGVGRVPNSRRHAPSHRLGRRQPKQTVIRFAADTGHDGHAPVECPALRWEFVRSNRTMHSCKRSNFTNSIHVKHSYKKLPRFNRAPPFPPPIPV